MYYCSIEISETLSFSKKKIWLHNFCWHQRITNRLSSEPPICSQWTIYWVFLSLDKGLRCSIRLLIFRAFISTSMKTKKNHSLIKRFIGFYLFHFIGNRKCLSNTKRRKKNNNKEILTTKKNKNMKPRTCHWS
jgi:hypothetical protein